LDSCLGSLRSFSLRLSACWLTSLKKALSCSCSSEHSTHLI
jgi:hypothetical protein